MTHFLCHLHDSLMTRFIMSPGDNNNTKQVIQKDAGNLYIYYIYDTKCEYPTRVPAITQTHVSRFKKTVFISCNSANSPKFVQKCFLNPTPITEKKSATSIQCTYLLF